MIAPITKQLIVDVSTKQDYGSFAAMVTSRHVLRPYPFDLANKDTSRQ